jgi:hypothetical protein
VFWQFWEEGGLVKKFKEIRVDSPNGEIHYLLRESSILNRPENAKNFDEVELKKSSKKDASKPLLLTRE